MSEADIPCISSFALSPDYRDAPKFSATIGVPPSAFRELAHYPFFACIVFISVILYLVFSRPLLVSLAALPPFLVSSEKSSKSSGMNTYENYAYNLL